MMKNQGKRLIFYDFEVFEEDFLVVFIEYATRKQMVIVNDREKLIKFYQKAKDFIFVGFNSRNYDSTIFKAIILGLNPHRVSVDLIEKGKKPYQVLPKEHKNIQLYNYDVSDGFRSLKQLEAFMGDSIEESSVPFDIKRKLTQEEIEETIKYCTHDVNETIKVFEYKKEDFQSMITLIDMFNLPMESISKTKAQLSATILEAERPCFERDDEWDIVLPDNLIINRYKDVRDWYLSDEVKKPNAKYKREVYGTEFTFSLGGCHNKVTKYEDEGLIACCDVALTYNWCN